MADRVLTKKEQAIMDLYSEGTYCIDLPPSPARQNLIHDKLLEWVPAPAWSGERTYALTEAGRAFRGFDK